MSDSGEVRRRRRPAYRSGRPTLTKEGIARAALDLLGDKGPAELTMRALAQRLGVSPRALYNYVTDRAHLLELIISLSQAARPEPRLDPARPEESLRGYCRRLRAWYRAHPGLLALARAEDLTAFASADLLRADDALVAFFLEIGLSPRDAYRAWAVTVLQVAGFAEVWDAWHDRPPPGADPATWGGLPPAAPAELPHLTEAEAAGDAAALAPDALFETVLDLLVAGIEAMRRTKETDHVLGG
ncbi:regulatory protein, tetR family [Nonomuraea solani]|uniref:Regulatory protein, tetR family n=1 Tax=Nonomuraea solani TaxID=1144553 RepID=A0A1H5YLA2_9ACTN|nr:TetR/AcrR family transcriptional regulator [Nonomuraea solani]SEG24858.1 regulatory protein, tetR family [Nonomuraea solani]